MTKIDSSLILGLNEIFNIYEQYIWRHDNSRLDVILQDNCISLYLYEDDEVIDEIIFNFGNGNRAFRIYRYMGIKMMLILLGNVIIKRDENILYNDVHKPYVKLIVNDESLLLIMQEIIDRQYNEVINDKMDVINNIYIKVPWGGTTRKFMNRLHERIGMSRMMLRNRERFGGK